MSQSKGKVAVIGSGLIGRSWAMLWAAAGYSVCLYDITQQILDSSLQQLRKQMTDLEAQGLLRGPTSANQQIQRIQGSVKLEDCVRDCIYVQECTPEDLESKKTVFQRLDEVTPPEAILASSTSTLVPSLFSEHLTYRNRVLVAHPVNPPYFVPLVEIVPASWTDSAVVESTRNYMDELGQAPVVLSRELPGFALNRIQYVILNECWHLVEDGILSVQDVDRVMSQGLGMRYAFLGPLETAHLNAEGMSNYCDRYRESMFKVGGTFKPVPKFEGPTSQAMARQLEAMTPLDKLPERRAWRDNCLTRLSVLKKQLDK